MSIEPDPSNRQTNAKRLLPLLPIRVYPRESAAVFSCPFPLPIVTHHSPLRPNFFPFTLLRTLLHSRNSQLFSFQSFPHSLHRTPGGWVWYSALLLWDSHSWLCS